MQPVRLPSFSQTHTHTHIHTHINNQPAHHSPASRSIIVPLEGREMVVGQLGEGVDHVSTQGGVQVLGDELASTWPKGGQ